MNCYPGNASNSFNVKYFDFFNILDDLLSYSRKLNTVIPSLFRLVMMEVFPRQAQDRK
jgi:hypothetical protein